MSGQPEADPTVEPSDAATRSAPPDRAFEKSDFLAEGRYSLSDADILSRANVRHLMARSDALDALQSRFDQLQVAYFQLSTELSVIKTKAERDTVYDRFITFCNSAGFAAFGFAASFLTTPGSDKTLPVIWTVFGLLIAGGSLLAQIRSKS